MIYAIVSGILLGFAFPLRVGQFVLPNLGWLAWVAFVPLFYTFRTATPWQAFSRTFVAACCYYSISLYWLYTALNTYGHLSPPISVAVLVLMILILGAYIGLAPWITRWVATRWEREPIWLLPAAWVAVEMCRNFGPCGGFPWINLAQSQFAYVPIIQIADVTGIWGLLFLIVWVNRWLAHCWGRALHDAEWRWHEPLTFVTIGFCILLVGYGALRVVAVERRVNAWLPYAVGLLQGNIPQEEKWRPGLEEEQVAAFQALERRLGDAPVDLVIWPEASYPWPIPVTQGAVELRHLGPWGGQLGLPWPILVGAVSVTREGGERRLYNSALAVDTNGSILGRYHKTHLVPFGEYVPYQTVFRFARAVAAVIGNYAAGREAAPVVIEGVTIGPLICYEDIFPEIARRLARRGAQLFANLTNDAWYGWSAAAEQHFALSIFRAVEHRRYVVRATNTGVSGIIDPVGRVVIKSPLFEPAVIVGRVRLGNGMTFYTRFGDWFAYLCILAVAVAAVWGYRKGRTG